jgi:hypothetical protein
MTSPSIQAAPTARRMWTLFEPVHVISYFAPAAKGAFEQAGLRGFWRGYFAGRAAPIGPVGPAPVVAAFFSFAPRMVSRALPAIWDLITPAEALAVRQSGAAAALSDLLGLSPGEPVPERIVAAADRLAAVAASTSGPEGAGRPLGGPNAALPVPDEPLARLWLAATVLREHRGDGHIAALVAAGLDGAEALALRAGLRRAAGSAYGHVPGAWKRSELQPMRGWTDDEWDAAAARLTARGLLDEEGSATSAGVTLHNDIEAATDLAAARPWARLTGEETAELAGLLEPVAEACAAVLPFGRSERAEA